MKQKDIKKGFTLLEVLIAIFIMSVGIAGVMTLITQTIFLSTLSSSKLTAAYLTQEGIELVRNIRDGNLLKQRNDPLVDWDDDLGVGDWEADYSSLVLNLYVSRYFKIDGGFYNYSSGIDTKFKRKITIFDKTDLSIPLDGIPDMFKILVLVEWQEKGKDYQTSAEDYLYNWR